MNLSEWKHVCTTDNWLCVSLKYSEPGCCADWLWCTWQTVMGIKTYKTLIFCPFCDFKHHKQYGNHCLWNGWTKSINFASVSLPTPPHIFHCQCSLENIGKTNNASSRLVLGQSQILLTMWNTGNEFCQYSHPVFSVFVYLAKITKWRANRNWGFYCKWYLCIDTTVGPAVI